MFHLCSKRPKRRAAEHYKTRDRRGMTGTCDNCTGTDVNRRPSPCAAMKMKKARTSISMRDPGELERNTGFEPATFALAVVARAGADPRKSAAARKRVYFHLIG